MMDPAYHDAACYAYLLCFLEVDFQDADRATAAIENLKLTALWVIHTMNAAVVPFFTLFGGYLRSGILMCITPKS
jgi:hypothetical protein